MKSKWIQNDRYTHVRDRIRELCKEWNIPIPIIHKSDLCEHCDSTDYDLIRIQCNQEDLPSYEDHARHLFIHYICNLEQTDISDRIVETIQERINW